MLEQLQLLLKQQPVDQAALLSHSLRLLQSGQPADAMRGFERLTAVNPLHAVAFNCLGIAHFDRGDPGRAIECYDKAISIKPHFAEAFSNRAGALARLGRDDEAAAACERALTINPRLAEAHNNLGNVWLKRAQFQRALSSFQRAVEIAPKFENAISNIILTQIRLEQLTDAKATAAQALKTHPKNVQFLLYAAEIEIALRAPHEAIALLQRARRGGPGTAQVHHMLGLAFFEAGVPDKAIAQSQEALKLEPKLAGALITIAAALLQQGKFDEALPYFDRAFELPGEFSSSYQDVAKTKKFRSNDDPHLRLFERKAADDLKSEGPVNPRRRVNLQFALGKAYDDLGRYDEAFACFSHANEIERDAGLYDEQAVMRRFAELKKLFTPNFLRGRGHADRASPPRPIFIVGMPRSGTTLVEQILSGRDGVYIGGELAVFDEQCQALSELLGAKYPDFLSGVTSAQIEGLGEEYMQAVRALSPSSRMITDKMPTNFNFAGLIHLALPGARIIHTIRDARDTCLSCFMTPWKHMEKFNTDLARMGRYYRAYFDLMSHWRTLLPPTAFLDVRYEDLISDPQVQTRRITDFCGVEWDPGVVEIQNRDGAVRTASLFQVRQSIYKTSVARWRNYEKWLGPLLDELGDLAGQP